MKNEFEGHSAGRHLLRDSETPIDGGTGLGIGLAGGVSWNVRLASSNGNVFGASPTTLPTRVTDYLGGGSKDIPYSCEDLASPFQVQTVCRGETYRWSSRTGVTSF